MKLLVLGRNTITKLLVIDGITVAQVRASAIHNNDSRCVDGAELHASYALMWWWLWWRVNELDDVMVGFGACGGNGGSTDMGIATGGVA
ncbi:Hypothetical predicted protein [Olea europaea subsp. europaea]|uniref:Uncharacterized protein n=1 Tax=Olea europaea subsp. europaea TaxID=158383 RepID=A0A8S0R5E5_OLEEU|nr:Hypothetical predicted protein [Olea europaea subsp. europaea]